MPLWRHNGTSFITVDWREKLRSVDVLAVCGGRSARTIERYDIHRPGIMVAAVDTGVDVCERPDMCICPRHPSSYQPWLHASALTKVYGGAFAGIDFHGKKLHEWSSVYFVDNTCDADLDKMAEEQPLFAYLESPVATAVHLLLWMGTRRIVLAGLDCDMDPWPIQHQYHIKAMAGLKKLCEAVRKCESFKNAEIVTCTPASDALKFMPYMSLSDAIECHEPAEVYVHIPTQNIDVEHLRRPRGIVTGVDHKQQWMLPWWIENVRKTNPRMPITVFNFGMTPEFSNGEYLNLSLKYWYNVARIRGECFCAWFKKPFALSSSPYDTTLWLDMDMEVRGDLEPLFELFDRGNDEAMAGGDIYDTSSRGIAWNSGVVMVHQDSRLVKAWCDAIQHEFISGDQEIMGHVIARHGISIAELPPGYNDIVSFEEPRDVAEKRFAELLADPGVKIIHHLGVEGKERIRRLMDSKA